MVENKIQGKTSTAWKKNLHLFLQSFSLTYAHYDQVQSSSVIHKRVHSNSYL